MLKDRYIKFTQSTPSTTWEINNIPEGALHASVLEVHLSGGAIVQPEYQTDAPYGIEMVLGVTPVAGVAIVKYFVEEEETQTISSGTNNVTISVVQNGGSSDGTTF